MKIDESFLQKYYLHIPLYFFSILALTMYGFMTKKQSMYCRYLNVSVFEGKSVFVLNLQLTIQDKNDNDVEGHVKKKNQDHTKGNVKSVDDEIIRWEYLCVDMLS